VKECAPSNVFRIDVKPGKGSRFLFRQIIGIGLVDAELLEATQHDGRKRSNALFERAEPAEKGLLMVKCRSKTRGERTLSDCVDS
jgi:hypothetical protein